MQSYNRFLKSTYTNAFQPIFIQFQNCLSPSQGVGRGFESRLPLKSETLKSLDIKGIERFLFANKLY